MERSQVEQAVESAYLYTSGQKPLDRIVEKNLFTTYMVLAIALCDVPKDGGRPSQSEGCFRAAIGWVEKVIAYSQSDLETLRAVLLLAQFVTLFPSWGSLWHLAGTALRLCIDIGLHWETDEQSLSMNADVLHERRRLWYSTYQFDRVLCITLGRPFGIIDESTRVPLPHPWAASRRGLGRKDNEFDIHHQRAHNHLFSMSKLESEIKHVLHSQTWTLKIAYPKTNYSAWVQDIHPRLQEWYTTIPEASKAHPSSIFARQAYWDAIFNNAILLLYRPHSIVQHAPTDALIIAFEASCKLIASIKILQRDGKVEVLWRSVLHLFMAGLGVIYGLWHSKEIRDQNPVKDSISTLQSCASTLFAMSETFHGAAGCRDVFDTLSSATVDWLVSNNIEETRRSRVDFEKQMNDLLGQLQPSRGSVHLNDGSGTNSMSDMLFADNFVFSEMLSSAAQWPDFGGMNFSDLGPNSLTATELSAGAYSFI
jgi:hypothetical protein